MATGFDPDDEPRVVHLFGMWVRPERQEGIGRDLVAAVMNWASERPDVERVVLRVTISNGSAVRFYASCGFVPTADPPEPLREGSTFSTRTRSSSWPVVALASPRHQVVRQNAHRKSRMDVPT